MSGRRRRVWRASARRSRRCSPTSRARWSLMEDLDPEEARAIVDPAIRLMIDAAHRYDGYIVQSTGDGIFALFGAPVAHEDHPQRALYAALRMQEEMKRYCRATARGEGAYPPSAGRCQHGRGGGAFDHDRRRHRPSTRRSGIRPTSLRGCRRWQSGVDRDQRAVAQTGRGLFHAQGAGSGADQRRQRAGQRLRGDRAGTAADAACSVRRGAG